MQLTYETITGSWIVAGSEIEHLNPGDEVYHFFPDLRFEAEFKNIGDAINCWKYFYEITDDGFRFGRPGKMKFAVTAWLDSGFLIFRPEHGMETWMNRLPRIGYIYNNKPNKPHHPTPRSRCVGDDFS